MSGFEVGLISAVGMILLIYLGMHVPVALALVSFVGVWAIRGNFDIAAALLWASAAQSVNSYVFGVVPLFVLMGMFVAVAGMGRDAYDIAQLLLRRVQGGLGMATVVANAIFASVTGASIASASVFSKIAVPEMLRYGYRTRFAVGVVAGSSVLGMLIPPSILLIFYAILTEQSVGDLFIAGIGPGLLLTAIFCLMIAGMAHFAPSQIWNEPSASSDEAMASVASREIWRKALPISTLILLVFGGIYGGVFNAIEAGGAGAFAAFLFALFRGRLNWKSLAEVLIDTGHITAALLFLIVAASMYSRMLGVSGLPTEISKMVIESEAGYAMLIFLYVLLVIILGTVIDSVSIMAIAVPLFMAALQPFDIDLVWFGIVTVIAVEIGLLTPPLGLSVYVVHSTLARADISLKDIFIGSAPFVGAMALVLLLVILMPAIATFLL